MTKNIVFLTILACLSAHSWPAIDAQEGFHFSVESDAIWLANNDIKKKSNISMWQENTPIRMHLWMERPLNGGR